MTRKNAIIKIYELVNMSRDDTTLKEFVDNIYDDFENRTCSNCKHSVMPRARKYDGKLICKGYGIGFITQNPYDGEALLFNTVKDDFSCNKWEQKDD